MTFNSGSLRFTFYCLLLAKVLTILARWNMRYPPINIPFFMHLCSESYSYFSILCVKQKWYLGCKTMRYYNINIIYLGFEYYFILSFCCWKIISFLFKTLNNKEGWNQLQLFEGLILRMKSEFKIFSWGLGIRLSAKLFQYPKITDLFVKFLNHKDLDYFLQIFETYHSQANNKLIQYLKIILLIMVHLVLILVWPIVALVIIFKLNKSI